MLWLTQGRRFPGNEEQVVTQGPSLLPSLAQQRDPNTTKVLLTACEVVSLGFPVKNSREKSKVCQGRGRINISRLSEMSCG